MVDVVVGVVVIQIVCVVHVACIEIGALSHLLALSLTYLLTHTHTHSFAHPPTHALTHALTHSHHSLILWHFLHPPLPPHRIQVSKDIAKQQMSVEQALQDINMVKNEILSRAWDEEFKKRCVKQEHLNLLEFVTCDTMHLC